MIYTVTFNPALDYVIAVDHFAPGQINRDVYKRQVPIDFPGFLRCFFAYPEVIYYIENVTSGGNKHGLYNDSCRKTCIL